MHLFKIKPIYAEGRENEQGKYPRGITYKYNEVIKEIGFGKYQYRIIATVAMLNLAMGVYISQLTLLIPLFKADIFISPIEVGFLIASQGLGALLGGITFSMISDISGRRLSLMIALTLVVSSLITCSLMHDFISFCVLRFIATLGYGGIMPVGVTYLTEYLPDNSRGFYIIGIDIFRSFGGLVTIAVAWMSNDYWRVFVLGPVPIFILGLGVILFSLPESSRYLLYKNQTEQLEKNLNDMWRVNGKNITIRYSLYDQEQTDNFQKRMKVSICRDLIVRKFDTTIPLLLLWFFPAFGTGVYVFLPEILLDRGFTMNEVYALSSFLTLTPMCGVAVSSFFIDTFGRKQVISMCALVAGLSLLTFCIFPDNTRKILIFYVILGVWSIFMKVLKCVTTAFTPEMYSTSTRTTALGVMNGADRFAGIIMPFIFTELVYTSFKLAMAGFASTFLIGFIVSLWITEADTANKPLRDSLLDVSENDIGQSALHTSMHSQS